MVPADKTDNFYKMDANLYNELVEKAVTKEYKTVENNIKDEINKKDSEIVTKLNLEDRIDVMPELNCFVTLKDHKPDFRNKTTVRLLNPNKPNIGQNEN